MKATVEIETITPAMAEELLASLHEKQRKLRPGYAEDIAKEMAQGNWRLSPDALTIIKGMVGNGQHRLTGVVLSRKACQFLVLRTDDEKLFEVIDSGIKRQVSDVVNSLGNAVKICACANQVICYLNHTMATVWGGKATRAEQLDYIKNNADSLRQNIDFCSALYAKHKILSPTWAAALMEISKKYDQQKVKTFIESLYTGDHSCSNACLLRDRLINNGASKAKLRKSYIFALMVKSLKAYMSGEDIESLRLAPGEAFPRLHGEVRTVKTK